MRRTSEWLIKITLLGFAVICTVTINVSAGWAGVTVSPSALNIGASDGFIVNWSGYSGNVWVSIYYDNGNPASPTKLCDAIGNPGVLGSSGHTTLDTTRACGSGWGTSSSYRVGIQSVSFPYNIYYSNYFYVYPKPDLIAGRVWLSSVSTPGTELINPKVGDQVYINFQFSVQNANVYEPIAIKGNVDGSNLLYNSSYTPTVNTGTYNPSSQTFSNYWTVTAGTHTVNWALDDGNQVPETNEGNNSLSRTYIVPQQFDLVHGPIDILDDKGNPSPGNVGDTVYFQLNYSVDGTGTTPPFSVACTLDGASFKTWSNITANGGQSYQLLTQGYLVTSGPHTVSCDLDSQNQLAESNETNNNSTNGWTAHLINPTVSVSPASGPVGTTFSEPGSGFSPNSTATLYFSGPDGPSTYSNQTTDDNGSFSHSWTCDACPVGSYSYYAKDDSTNNISNTAYFTVYATTASPTFTPLYRLYNASIKDHFYTTSATERDNAVSNSGYTYEGVEGFVSSTNFTGSVPLYRLYSPSIDMHYYTTSASDKDDKVAGGFVLENVYYIYPTEAEWTTPLYHSEDTLNTDNFYTTSKYEYEHSLISWGFTDRGIVGYIAASVANNRPQGRFEGVGMITGNLTLPPITDLSLRGLGPQLSFTRYYDSFSPGTSLGKGWSFNYDSYILGDVSGVHVHWGNGLESHFDSSLQPYPGNFEKIVKIDDGVNYGYDVTTKDQTLYEFRRFTLDTPGPDILLISITDRHGNSLTLSRDASYGFVMSATDATGRKFDYAYAPVTITDGRTVQRLTSVTDESLARTIYFTYDSEGNLASISDARNGLWTTRYNYNSDGLLESITYPEGNTVSMAYDDNLRVSNETIDGATYAYTYNPAATVVTGPQGAITYTPKADDSYRLAQIQFPDTDKSTIVPTYDTGTTTLYLPQSITDRDGNSTNSTYDANGNVLSVKNALNETYTYTYDDKNNLRSATDPRGNTTTYNYDSTLTDLTGVVKQASGTTAYTYYSNGLVETSTDPDDHTISYTYDQNGNLASITDGLGNSVTFTYDSAGRMTSKTDQMGNKTTFAYDNNDNLASVCDANGGCATYTYDRDNRLTEVKDPRGQTTGGVTSYGYNPSNQLISRSDPLGNAYSFAYSQDGKGNLSSVSEPNGNVINYTYDAQNRPYQILLGSTPKVTYSYDNNGNPLSVIDENGTSSFSYDALNRMTSYYNSYVGKSFSSGYDASGNINRITYPGSKVVSYVYDADNRLKTVTDWLNSGSTTYTYTGNLLTSVTNPNGTKTDYSYDSDDRLTGLSNKFSNGTPIAEYSLTFNTAGDPTQLIKNEPAVPTVTPTNIISTYDAANRLATAGGVPYAFDKKGNLTTVNGTPVYSFDFANRLTKATIGGQNLQYKYDGFGNRIARTEGGSETRYVLDLNGDMSNVLAETDSAGNITNYYVYGLGPVSKITAGGQRYTYHFDNIGNTVSMTDDSQKVVNKYAYDEFGKALSVSETTPNSFRYVGKYGVMDEGNGLLYMRARYYDVENGRFISKDPLGFNGGDLNLYEYVGGNPVTSIDPTGLKWAQVWHAFDVSVGLLKRSIDLVELNAQTDGINFVTAFNAQKIASLSSAVSKVSKGVDYIKWTLFFYKCGDWATSRAAGRYYGVDMSDHTSMGECLKVTPGVSTAIEFFEMEKEAWRSLKYLTK